MLIIDWMLTLGLVLCSLQDMLSGVHVFVIIL